MPYLDFVHPITEKDITKKVLDSYSRNVWLQGVLNFIMALLKAQFIGKVINVKLSNAIKDKKEEYTIAWIEDGDRFLSQNNKRALKVHSSTNRDWVLYMDVMLSPDGILDWDATVKKADEQLESFKEGARQAKQLLDNPGIVKGLIKNWELAIGCLKTLNNEASKYDVLTYEFDISRYK